MFVIPLIERKRNGQSLTPEEWRALVNEYTAGRVPDYQMAALLMAVFLNGLTTEELGALTNAMRDSGARLEFGDHVGPRIDKHSTGGVGDKVSLILAPLVASCGVAVPMMSGRGLGHTGGTLDKLEAIPGFRTDLSLEETRRQVERLGCAMIGQTEQMVPADRKLYALRDATATVEAVPLIAASIMSKKLAEGLNGLVLDVKRGSGAFMPELDAGLALAETMVGLGEERGCPTVALLTAMDRPLGHACGNALETEEAFASLRGEGPVDLMEVTYSLGAEMLVLAAVEENLSTARAALEDSIRGGRAERKFREIIDAQGGNPAVLDDPAVLGEAPVIETFEAPSAGCIARVEPRTIGRAIVAIGGGRQMKEDDIDLHVGFVITAKPGDRVEHGEPLASIHARNADDMTIARRALSDAIEIVPDQCDSGLPLISHRVTKAGIDDLAADDRR